MGSDMSTNDELFERVMALPPPERADLAWRILRSLEPEEVDADWDAAWGEDSHGEDSWVRTRADSTIVQAESPSTDQAISSPRVIVTACPPSRTRSPRIRTRISPPRDDA